MSGDICPNCGRFNTTEAEIIDQYFLAIPFGAPIKVLAKYPVTTCSDCKESFSDWRGEQARSEATYHALMGALQHSYELLRGVLPTMNPKVMGDTMREISEVLRK